MTPRALSLVIGFFVAAALAFACWQAGLESGAALTAAVTGLCACWWVLEPIPIPATSLIPLAVFPLTGVLNSKQLAASYGHHLIMLLMGGFMLSLAIEKSGAHRRMALGMVRLTGGSGRRLVLGFMIASAVCSMWMSNTATTLMLLPVAIAVLGDDPPAALNNALLLGIAYAASIGGVATPIGTPPNVVFIGIYQQATGIEISFLEWMGIGLPVAVTFVPLAWLYLTRSLGESQAAELPPQGPWRPAEVRVLTIFALAALAWVFRAAPSGGWSLALGQLTDDPVAFAAGISDSSIAMLAVVIMFLVPAGNGESLLTWKTAVKIPWGLLLLFGGGIAIAEAFRQSGLSEVLGQHLSTLAGFPILVTTAALCLAVTFLTEVTSNTATTTLLMPILAAAGIAASIDPRTLMIPAALSASCAFMLPVATAPNAIMFGTGRITTKTMAREGLWLNLIGAVIITVLMVLIL